MRKMMKLQWVIKVRIKLVPYQPLQTKFIFIKGLFPCTCIMWETASTLNRAFYNNVLIINGATVAISSAWPVVVTDIHVKSVFGGNSYWIVCEFTYQNNKKQLLLKRSHDLIMWFIHVFHTHNKHKYVCVGFILTGRHVNTIITNIGWLLSVFKKNQFIYI